MNSKENKTTSHESRRSRLCPSLAPLLLGALAATPLSCSCEEAEDGGWGEYAWGEYSETAQHSGGARPPRGASNDDSDYSSFLQPVNVKLRGKGAGRNIRGNSGKSANASPSIASSSNTPETAAFSSLDITPAQVPNLYQKGILHILYGTNSWMLQQNDLRDLAQYARSLEQGQSLIAEGYADHRGSESWNMELSGNRAEGVERYLQGIRQDIVVQTTAYGESRATADGENARETQRDRVVRLIANKSVIRRGLDLLAADYYLIDQSASMNELLPDGRRKWDEVQAYQFPPKAQAYTFTTVSRTANLPLMEISPGGGTPLYFSLYGLVLQCEFGKDITTLTDGADTERGPTPEDIIQEARRKKIALSFVMLGHHSEALMEIARVTGGKVYIGAVR